MFDFFFIAAFAMVISLVLTPVMMVISRKLKILDLPNGRKMHTKPIPLMGGIAIYLAAIITTNIYLFLFVEGLEYNLVFAFIIGISGVTLMGLIDDILTLSPKRRLITLFILALIVLVGCLQFYFPPTLFANLGLTLLISFIIVFWIVAITNAINLTDGLDGLAGSLSLVSTAAFAIIFYLQGRTQLALPTTLALCGAIAGFLVYNISPAKIFMGDAGSMFIGFMLGIMTVMSMSQKDVIVIVVPVYLMLVPILDLCMSVLRRLLLHVPIMKPDKMHFHHGLVRRLKSHRRVVLILAAVQSIFAAIGVLIYMNELYIAGIIGLVIIGGVCAAYTFIWANAKRKQQAADSIQT